MQINHSLKDIRIYIAIITAIIVGGFFGFLAGVNSAPADLGPPDLPAGVASMMIDHGNGLVEVLPIDISENKTLLDTMSNLADIGTLSELEVIEYEGLGSLVNSINKTTNGDEGKYWSYWVNHVFAEVGADTYIPQDGDYIEWKFAPPQNF